MILGDEAFSVLAFGELRDTTEPVETPFEILLSAVNAERVFVVELDAYQVTVES